MVRFLHTSDWQLGMTRHFFSDGTQELFAQARFDAVKKMGDLARNRGCDFMVVAGDVFESPLVNRKTVNKALEALRQVPVPVYLLPGNHDPLDPSSVYKRKPFTENCPDHVHVLDSSEPLEAADSVEIVGVPWVSKTADRDLVSEVLSGIDASAGPLRVVVAHGILDTVFRGDEGHSSISLENVEKAIREGKFHFLALGDRHSALDEGKTGKVWYSGTPEATSYREEMPGHALIVDLSREECSVEPVKVGSWAFIERDRVDLDRQEDVDALDRWFEELQGKERTVVKIRLCGTVTLSVKLALDGLLERARDLVAALEVRDTGLEVIPDDADFEDLELAGFAAKALEKLRTDAEKQDEEGARARDALALLIRLNRGVS